MTTPTPVRPWPEALQKGSHESPDAGMCVLEAVAWVHGLPHSDTPPCVPAADAAFLRSLNDSTAWPSGQARAKALIPLARRAMAAKVDRTVWVRALQAETIRRVLPLALRAAADEHPNAAHAEALRAASDRCERAGTEGSAYSALEAAAARAAAYSAAYSAAARAAADAADAAALEAAAYSASAACAAYSASRALEAAAVYSAARDAAYSATRTADTLGAAALEASVAAAHAAYDATESGCAALTRLDGAGAGA